jgi:hypothetical protein
MMERGGMYRAGEEQPAHFSQWREGGKQDLYQDLAAALLVNLRSRIGNAFSQEQFDALQVITGKLEKDGKVSSKGRNLVKTPLTAFAFGSSLKRSVEAMEDKFIAGIYDAIEELARNGEDAAPLIRAINLLVRSSNPGGKATPETITAKELLAQALPVTDEKALRESFQGIMSESVEATMNTYFATFIQRRLDLNSTIQAGYAMYAAAFAAAREQLMEKLMASGEMAYRIGRTGKNEGKKIPLHDLSVEQENALRKELSGLLPVAHTAYSIKSGNIDQGLYMAKSEAGLSNDALYQSKTTLANGIERANGGNDACGT